jgi:hypothetical protein
MSKGDMMVIFYLAKGWEKMRKARAVSALLLMTILSFLFVHYQPIHQDHQPVHESKAALLGESGELFQLTADEKHEPAAINGSSAVIMLAAITVFLAVRHLAFALHHFFLKSVFYQSNYVDRSPVLFS